MKRHLRGHAIPAVLSALVFSLVLMGQDRWNDRPSTGQTGSCVAASVSLSHSSCRVIHAIDDPATQEHWWMVRDSDRPAAPAQLVLSCAAKFSEAADRHARIERPAVSPAVIHVGDPLMVDEHTEVSDGLLEATALSVAAIGETVLVRLKMGHAILRARVTAPGRGSLLAGRSEARR